MCFSNQQMVTKQQAHDRAIELAIESGDVDSITKALRDEGFGGLLSDDELMSIVIEAGMMRQIQQNRPRYTLVRVIGVVAVLMGGCAILLGGGDDSLSEAQLRKYSPMGWGTIALVVGLVLIVKPSLGKSDIS